LCIGIFINFIGRAAFHDLQQEVEPLQVQRNKNTEFYKKTQENVAPLFAMQRPRQHARTAPTGGRDAARNL
jgi:hypothetical protein